MVWFIMQFFTIFTSIFPRNPPVQRLCGISTPTFLEEPEKNKAEEIRQELREIGERNEVEGKYGTGKRKFGLSCIMGKLKETSGSMVCMDIYIMNMEYQLRHGILCAFFEIRKLVKMLCISIELKIELLAKGLD